MARQAFVAWTCDRCAVTEQVDDPKEPSEWATIREERQKPQTRDRAFDLCPVCVASFVKWMAAKAV